MSVITINNHFLQLNIIACKNSCLIINEYSSILLRAVVQIESWISLIPTWLLSIIHGIYDQKSYEIIAKIKSVIVSLDEVSFDLKNVVKTNIE